jgi:ankyrin
MQRGFLVVLVLSVASISGADSGPSLVDAVIHSDAVRVRTLLESGANANMLSTDGQTSLYIAADQGSVEIAKVLLDHRADVNAVSPTSIESEGLVVPGKGGMSFEMVPNDKNIRMTARDTPLIIAAWRGHVELVALLIAHGADVNTKGTHRWPPLLVATKKGHSHVVRLLLTQQVGVDLGNGLGEIVLRTAIIKGSPEIVKTLLDAGVSAKGTTTRGPTPLVVALNAHNGRPAPHSNGLSLGAKDTSVPVPVLTQPGRIEILEMLLNAGADPNAKAYYLGRTVLHQTTRLGDTETVGVLLKNGADVNAQDDAGETALHEAAREGHIDVVNLLLKHRADVDRVSPGGHTALFYASIQGHVDVVNALLDRGADVNGKSVDWTPLLAAIQRRQSGVIDALLKHGANVNVLSSQGDSPLHTATVRGDLNLIKVLLDHGANPNLKSKYGQTPLHQVAGTDLHDVAKLLLSRGAAVNEQNADGKTALHLVSNRGAIEVATVLLDGGANVRARDKSGNSPLFDASSLGRVDVASLLLARGADVNATSTTGRSPLHVAADSGQSDIVTLLLKHGAKIDAQDEVGQTARHLAYMAQQRAMVNLLKTKGAKDNVEDRMGMLPRDYAAEPESPVYSREEMVALEQTFDEIWRQMLAALKKGDGKGALRYVVEERRPRYETVFEDLLRDRKSTDMETLFGDSSLHCFVPGDDWETVRNDWAHSIYRPHWHRRYVICEMVRTEHGTKYSYEIQFTRARDNVWRISGF